MNLLIGTQPDGGLERIMGYQIKKYSGLEIETNLKNTYTIQLFEYQFIEKQPAMDKYTLKVSMNGSKSTIDLYVDQNSPFIEVLKIAQRETKIDSIKNFIHQS